MKKLQKPKIKESIQRRIHKNLDKINRRQEDINDQSEVIKNSILEPCKKTTETKKKKKEWITEEILKMIDERRRFKE